MKNSILSAALDAADLLVRLQAQAKGQSLITALIQCDAVALRQLSDALSKLLQQMREQTALGDVEPSD